jgi:hypothetical protein
MIRQPYQRQHPAGLPTGHPGLHGLRGLAPAGAVPRRDAPMSSPGSATRNTWTRTSEPAPSPGSSSKTSACSHPKSVHTRLAQSGIPGGIVSLGRVRFECTNVMWSDLATGLLTQACHPLLPHLPRAWDICKNGPGLVYVLHHNRKTLAETPTITGPEDGMPSTALDTHACACASRLLLCNR